MTEEDLDPKNDLPFNVECEDIYRTIGKVSKSRDLKASQIELVENQKYLLIFHWPAAWEFFNLLAEPQQVEVVQAAPTKSKRQSVLEMLGASADEPVESVEFSDDLEELYAYLIKILGEKKVRAAFGEFGTKRQFLFRETTGKDLLRLTFRVDTDLPLFLRWTQSEPTKRIKLQDTLNGKEFWLLLSYLAFPLGENPNKLRPIEKELGIKLHPCKDLKPCAGHVAFDFGNNGSTIAFIPNGARSADAIELVSAEPLAPSEGQVPSDTLVSAIRVIDYVPPKYDPEDPENKRGEFSVADWRIGKEAVKFGEGTLVAGLKRLLADPKPEPMVPLKLGKGDSAMPKSDAAELYLSKLFHAFHREKLALAMPLTVTYPSTYSQREILRLFKAITRSFYRARKYLKLADDKIKNNCYALIKTPLDEASAAAIYFIYRDFIEGPGQTAGFKYLYPEGVNLLLYDCGGGTTDISLIHAFPKLTERIEEQDGQTNRHEVWQVKLDVIGRTGLRNFGGENITAAVFLAAKWLLAHIAAPDDVPVPTADVASDLDKHRDLRMKWNQYLPTAWIAPDGKTPLVTEENEINRRKALAHEFTGYAELLKVWLSTDRNKREDAPDITGETGISRELVKAGKEKRFAEILAKFKSRAADLEALVDAIIQPEIDLSIQAANNLIRDRLAKPTSGPVLEVAPAEEDQPKLAEDEQEEADTKLKLPSDSCMHWLYVVGQASLYPLISKQLKESAAVADVGATWLDQSRMIFEQDSLKNAVVKGAVLARMAVTTVEDTEFLWDGTLSNRLAFDIGLMLAGRGPRLVFEENQYYDELEPYPMETAMGALDGQSLRLYRRWPGMPRMKGHAEWQPYILFQFPEPPAGRICIYYDAQESQEGEPAFCVYVESSKKTYVGVELTEDRFIPPLQRGDL